MSHLKTLLASVAVVMMAAGGAQAAIVGAVGGTINAGGPGFGTLAETFNQAGLSAGYVSGVTDFDTYVPGTSHSVIFNGFEWFSENPSNAANVTYDLGSVLNINKMALWNEEVAGIGLMSLLVSSDNVTFSSLAVGLMPTNNPLSSDYFADVFTFAATSFRYIQLDMTGCPQEGGGFPSCAIGEVAFNSVAAVPVPASLPLLIGALGGLGLIRRRRKSA